MPLSIDLSDDEQRRFDALAARAGRTADEFAHTALTTGLEELEEIAWAEDSARGWIDSEQKTRPLKDLRREVDL
jgi:RHH-type rel operon transcriptional repressor/antitoxin RelB